MSLNDLAQKKNPEIWGGPKKTLEALSFFLDPFVKNTDPRETVLAK